jgi:heat shock protein HslJ/uncharacterized lipoprotein NlpE involved in copper resistance
MKKIILLLAFVSIISCQKKASSNNNGKESKSISSLNAKYPLNYIGTYKGILPCADCDGLETVIAINENSTYSVATKYLGKGAKVYIQKGNFAWNKKKTIIILTDVINAPNQYLVGKNNLTQLDLSGQKISGSLANEYILSKQPTDTLSIESVTKNNEATVDLNSRMATTTVIQKVNPAVGKYTLAETKWKLISLNKTKVNQEGNKVYFLKLNSKDARFSAYAGCNSIAGNYIMPSSDTLDFSEVIMTRMACPDMTLEEKFGAMLVQVINFKLEGETLTLFGQGKKTLAKFVAIK